ncbi:MAG: glycosyltransferase family 4 protein [Candidatus Woesearchaeota archaeon]
MKTKGKRIFVSCKQGPHFTHAAFAKTIGAEIIPCCKKFGDLNNFFMLLEAFARGFCIAVKKKPAFLISEGMESIYLCAFIKLFSKDCKLLYHDADPFFYSGGVRLKGVNRLFSNFFLKKIDYAISDSEISKSFLVKHLKLKKDVPVVFPFVNVAQFRDSSKKQRKNILYAGRFAPEKNLFNLLKAFRIVQDRFPGIKLYLIGAGYKGLLENELLETAKELGLKNVVWLGWVKDVSKHLDDSVIGYNVSLFEPFGCTALEFALAGAVPLIGLRNGNSEVFNDSRIVCNPDNHKDIAKKMIHILSMEQSAREKLLKELQSKAEKINEKAQCKRFKNAVEQLLDE